MAEVKFVNVAKYNGIRYPAHTPFHVDDNDVDALIAKGAIVLVPPMNKVVEPEKKEKTVDEMPVAELKAYAEEKGIDISKVEKKADILDAIKSATPAE